MRNIFFIILFLSFSTYSQNYDYLKKLDTIYVKFKEGKTEKKFDVETRITANNFGEKIFQFYIKNSMINLNFEHAKYKNLEKKNSNIISEKKKINKKFLKEKKNLIISISSLKHYAYEQIACNIFSQLKVIYIIDYNEKTIYEVNSMNYCPSIE
ncbi:hypothetical protein JI750_18755 [Flavobacterium sp. GN10]|uniref:GLPGLI family protein n=1 Tax=Flavobacterium tagetis TaxID=2801336 RepID=A0ABS1KIA5_9FLAO|nr:hypothetical protein [Flavobacterium tagetis]MBL0738942.1 hypothetical protein [Flavobacterium tagetis]